LFYQEHGQRFCRKHLNNWLKIGQEKEDEEATTKIGAIIQCEQQRSFWQKLNMSQERSDCAALLQYR
jgi:hypothetical protein